MLTANQKYIDTANIKHLLGAGEKNADKIQIAVDRYYHQTDLSDCLFTLRAVNSCGGLVMQNLEKETTENQIILTWTITEDFTAVSGELLPEIVGQKDDTVVIKYEMTPMVVRNSILEQYKGGIDAIDKALREMQSILSQAEQLIAKMPILMDGAYQAKRHKFDNASMIIHQIRPEEGTAESILSLIRNDRNYTKEEAQLLDIMLSIHAEHGGGNNSTFACRVATSSGTDPYAAYTTAINSLKGSRHGGANIKVVQMLDCIKENVKNWGNRGEVADFITKILKKEAGDGSGLIYGMGHAVYTLSDPRAVILKRKAFEMAKGKEIEAEFQLLSLIEELTPILMKEVRGVDKAMCANVDMYSGLVYRMLGIPDELFTPLFASARMVGWAAHRMEELLTGKRIIRPAYKPITKVKPYIPLCDRKD